MKMTIFKKLLIVMLIITLIPLLILGLAALNDAKLLGSEVTLRSQSMGDEMVADTTVSLNELGETIIKQKAIDVAKQMEIFIKSHPEMSVSDLQKDAYFKSLAVQPVGKTGYTAVHDVKTLINRFHAKNTTVNTDLHALETKLPGFFGVIIQSEGGKEVSGYYDWAEPDGSIKQKYMYVSSVNAKTADGVILGVAATTYIDEFSAPVVQTKEKINGAVSKTKDMIALAVTKMQNTVIVIFILTIFFLLLLCMSFAHSISKPIKALKDAADKITSGEFDVVLPNAKGSDEVSELTGSVEMLITAFKAKTAVKEPETKTTKKK
jgi:methyl-accepting chemotaxis protein